MHVFVSYARQDRAVVDGLVEDLEGLGHTAWYDDDLTGGQAWWNEIIRQLQACDAMAFVVSRSSSRSEACRLEAGYAAGLARPIVPVQVDLGASVRLLPACVAERQFVDYTERDADAIIDLTRALAAVPADVALPSPLPEPPPVPISYLTGLAQRIDDEAPLGADQQRAALAELRARLGDEDQRADVVGLLRLLQRRADVLASVARDIDEVLAQALIQQQASPTTPGAPAPSGVDEAGEAPPGGRAGVAGALAERGPGRSRPSKRALVVGGGALAAAVLAMVAFLVVRDEGGGQGVSAGGQGGGPQGQTGTFVGMIDDDNLLVRDVSVPEDSVIILRGTPIDDLDVVLGLASEDSALVGRYRDFYDGSVFAFDPFDDPFTRSGDRYGAVLEHQDRGASRDEELVIFPAPFGGGFEAVLDGYDGDTGRVELEIIVESFAGPTAPGPYLEALLEQPFVTGELASIVNPLTPLAYVAITDDTSTISVEVPEGWEQVDGTPAASGASLQASPDLAEFRASFFVPGLSIAVRGPAYDLDARLDEVAGAAGAGQCQATSREDYADRLYSGRIEALEDCAGTGTVLVVLVATPADQAITIEVVMQLTPNDDPSIGEHISQTFRVAGS